jgi:hypothetical protein
MLQSKYAEPFEVSLLVATSLAGSDAKSPLSVYLDVPTDAQGQKQPPELLLRPLPKDISLPRTWNQSSQLAGLMYDQRHSGYLADYIAAIEDLVRFTEYTIRDENAKKASASAAPSPTAFGEGGGGTAPAAGDVPPGQRAPSTPPTAGAPPSGRPVVLEPLTPPPTAASAASPHPAGEGKAKKKKAKKAKEGKDKAASSKEAKAARRAKKQAAKAAKGSATCKGTETAEATSKKKKKKKKNKQPAETPAPAERDRFCDDHKTEEQNRVTIRSLEVQIRAMSDEIGTLQALVSNITDQRDTLASRLRQVLASSTAPSEISPDTKAETVLEKAPAASAVGTQAAAPAEGTAFVSSSSTSSASEGSEEEGDEGAEAAAAAQSGATAPEEEASEHASPKLDSDVEPVNAAA